VFSVIFLPAIAVARGVETMSGQNIGADEPDRAAATNHFAAKVMFVILATMGVFVWLAAHPVVAVFTDDPNVVSVGVTFLRYVAPTFGFIGVMRSYTGGFRGAGKTLTAAALSFLMLWVVRLPLAWVGATELGSNGIWVAFAVSNVVGGLAAFAWFTRGTWREADLTEEDRTRVPADD
jgi:Na+-driven multidrug efflux pump